MTDSDPRFSADSGHAQISFLREAANYFRNRPTHGEDSAFWSNVANADNCEKAANLIERMHGVAQPSGMRMPTRADIGVLIRDNTNKETGWLQYLPAADAILNYWAILNKAALASQPSPAATVETDGGELRALNEEIEQVRAAALEAEHPRSSAATEHVKVADWLEDQARIATNSLHCGDNSAIIQQTHDWANKLEAAARHLRAVPQTSGMVLR